MLFATITEVTSIGNVVNVGSFIDYLADHSALGPFLLGISASLAWLFNKYYSYVYWRHTKDVETVEHLIAIKTEIKQNIASFTRNFTLKNYRIAIANVRAMEAAGNRHPMITGEAGENVVFESIKSRLTVLPTDLVEPIVAYYTKEAEFSASYSALANPILPSRNVEITVGFIRTTHLDAIQCIKQGRLTVRLIDEKTQSITTDRNHRLFLNILLLIALVTAAISGVPWQ